MRPERVVVGSFSCRLTQSIVLRRFVIFDGIRPPLRAGGETHTTLRDGMLRPYADLAAPVRAMGLHLRARGGTSDSYASREVKRPTASSNPSRDRRPLGGAVRPGAVTGSAGGSIPRRRPGRGTAGGRSDIAMAPLLCLCNPAMRSVHSGSQRAAPSVQPARAPSGHTVSDSAAIHRKMGIGPDVWLARFPVRRGDRSHPGEPGATLRARRRDQEHRR